MGNGENADTESPVEQRGQDLPTLVRFVYDLLGSTEIGASTGNRIGQGGLRKKKSTVQKQRPGFNNYYYTSDQEQEGKGNHQVGGACLYFLFFNRGYVQALTRGHGHEKPGTGRNGLFMGTGEPGL